jgi:hypothetical protein
MFGHRDTKLARDPELDDEDTAMVQIHAAAQQEHVRNAMILAKRYQV